MSNPASSSPWTLVDRFGRRHHALRISVTDACNLRCRYCMPETVGGFLPQDHLLTWDQIARVVDVLSRAGVDKVRITGGEPLMRPGVEQLIRRLSSLGRLRQIALTTNGMMLEEQIDGMVAAGLSHVNISLDTLREPAFRQMARRDGLDRVLAGIDAALRTGIQVRLNALVLRDINLEDCIPLVEFARDRGVVLRFIEFMPLDADRSWSASQVVPGHELRALVEQTFGALTPASSRDPSQPSQDFLFADGVGGIGFIDPVSKPFCQNCNRLRLTADGKFRNCLFGQEEWDVKSQLLQGAEDDAIYALARECVLAKFASHGISDSGFTPPVRAMYQIGG